MDPAPRSVEDLESAARELLATWCALDLWPIAITWRSEMRTRAGVAWLDERAVELNPTLLAENPSKIDEILAHELAHIVVWRRHGSTASEHGPEWRSLMRAAGFVPSRFHGLDVRQVRRVRRRYYYLHMCSRCTSWWIARRVRRDRDCSSCGPGEVEILRAPATSEGLAALRARGEARREGERSV